MTGQESRPSGSLPPITGSFGLTGGKASGEDAAFIHDSTENIVATASPGDTVRVHYTGTLEDGQEFDSSRGGDPIAFQLGSHQVIPGFEEAIVGMTPGETKTVTLDVDQAYGAHREDLVFTVPQGQFPPDMKLEPGLRVTATTQNGQQIDMVVIELGEDTVTLDANHPLAGKPLTFEIELVGIGGE